MLSAIRCGPASSVGLKPIGGPARLFARVYDLDQLREALQHAAESRLPLLILGGGSNLLIADEGFDGLVVHLDLRGITVNEMPEHVIVRVAAGEDAVAAPTLTAKTTTSS